MTLFIRINVLVLYVAIGKKKKRLGPKSGSYTGSDFVPKTKKNF